MDLIDSYKKYVSARNDLVNLYKSLNDKELIKNAIILQDEADIFIKKEIVSRMKKYNYKSLYDFISATFDQGCNLSLKNLMCFKKGE